MATTCPLTEEEWLKAEKNFKCSSGIYHCLRTRENFLIEVCAPRSHMIQSGGCPYYNINGNVDRMDCSMYPGCPDEPFLSKTVYKYPFCYQQWSTSITMPTSTSTATSTQSTTLEANSTLMSTKLTTTASIPYSFSDRDLPYMMIFLSCLIVVVLVFAMVIYHLCSKKKPKGGDIETGEEMDKLLDSADGQKSEDSADGQKSEDVEVNLDTNFVKSNAYERGIRLLKDKHTVTIIGYPGSGRSVTAREIVHDFEKKGWTCSIFDTLEDVHVDLSVGRQVIFLDNCFGKLDLQPSVQVVHRMKEILSSILCAGYRQTDGIKVLLSMEKRAYEKYKELLREIPTLDLSVMVDMDSNDSLTIAQREKLIEIILGDIEPTTKQSIKECLNDNSEARFVGFPLKVRLLKIIPGLQVSSNKWIEALRKIFNDMRLSCSEVEQKNYIAMMYVLLKGRVSADDEFDEQCMEQLLSSLPGQPFARLEKQDLLDVLNSISGFIKKKDEKYFVFAHEILYAAAFIEFHKNDAHIFFKYCNMKSILEIVKLSFDETVGNPLVIILPRDQYHILAERILKSGYQEEYCCRQLGEAAKFWLVLDKRQRIMKTEEERDSRIAKNEDTKGVEERLSAENKEYVDLLNDIKKS